jgi:hypothetical protein
MQISLGTTNFLVYIRYSISCWQYEEGRNMTKLTEGVKYGSVDLPIEFQKPD